MTIRNILASLCAAAFAFCIAIVSGLRAGGADLGGGRRK